MQAAAPNIPQRERQYEDTCTGARGHIYSTYTECRPLNLVFHREREREYEDTYIGARGHIAK
jgi:hypothetical protein